jgi:hypothetical protein
MSDPRHELSSAEFRRYCAECRRLAELARPRVKPEGRKLKAPRRAAWFGSLVGQLRAPAPSERGRRLIAVHAKS